MTTWFCLASGPSMCREDAEAIKGHGKVIAINNTIQLAPWADVLYSCDHTWWRAYEALHADFKGEKAGIDPQSARFGVTVYRRSHDAGLGLDRLHTGNNSGYQAINLAYLKGARRIVLLGYDMQHTDGRHHWHADHPRPLGNFAQGMPALCLPKFTRLAQDLEDRGVEVLNATRQTALRCFKRVPLAAALA